MNMEIFYIVVATVVAIVLLALYCYMKELFPWQWWCMYDNDTKDSKCANQCRFCRNMQNSE